MTKNKKHIILYIVLIVILFIGLYIIGNYNLKHQNAVEDDNRFEFNYRYQNSSEERNFSIKKDENKYYYLYEIKSNDNITSNTYVVSVDAKKDILELVEKYEYQNWSKLKDKDKTLGYDLTVELIVDGYRYSVNDHQAIDDKFFKEAYNLLGSYIK